GQACVAAQFLIKTGDATGINFFVGFVEIDVTNDAIGMIFTRAFGFNAQGSYLVREKEEDQVKSDVSSHSGITLKKPIVAKQQHFFFFSRFPFFYSCSNDRL